MKTIKTISSLLALGSLLAAGCTTYDAPETQSISEAIDLSRLDTFTVRVNGGGSEDTAFGPVAQNEALEDIVEELEDLGYDYVEGDAADFVVVFTSAVQDETGAFTTSYSSPTREVVTREEQTVLPDGEVVTTDRDTEVVTTYESTPIQLNSTQRLYVMDIVDAQTDVLIWRGYMTSDDLEISDADEIEEYIERIVDRLPRD